MSPPGGRIRPRVHETDTTWRLSAACRPYPTSWWYPEFGDAHSQLDAARRICRTCPVAAPCLQFALDTNQKHGMFGDTTPKERRRLRRELRLVS